MARTLASADRKGSGELGFIASAAGLAALGLVWVAALVPMALLAGGAAVTHALGRKGLLRAGRARRPSSLTD